MNEHVEFTVKVCDLTDWCCHFRGAVYRSYVECVLAPTWSHVYRSFASIVLMCDYGYSTSSYGICCCCLNIFNRALVP